MLEGGEGVNQTSERDLVCLDIHSNPIIPFPELERGSRSSDFCVLNVGVTRPPKRCCFVCHCSECLNNMLTAVSVI